MGNVHYLGGDGNDLIFTDSYSSEVIEFHGGDDQDKVYYFDSTDQVKVYDSSAQSITQVGSDIVVVFSATDQITFRFTDMVTVQSALHFMSGTPGDDYFFAGPGADTISGGDGNDYISGAGGDDTLHGDVGADNLYGDGDNDTLDGGDGNDWLNGGDGSDTIDGGNGNDILIGGNGDDVIYTGSAGIGGNLVVDGAGNDTVYGGADQDLIHGAAGDDYYNGGAGVTGFTIIIRKFWQGSSWIWAWHGPGPLLGSGRCGEHRRRHARKYRGGGRLRLCQRDDCRRCRHDARWQWRQRCDPGNDGDDTLDGGSDADRLFGNGGNDTLDGGTGEDKLYGGAGNDIFVVDNIGDATVEVAGEGTDLVQSSITHTLKANIENLTLTGAAALNGTGNALGNAMTGNAGRQPPLRP